MSKKASSTRIGAFVLGAVALVIVVIAVFGGGRIFAQKDYYVIFFRGSAVGLDVGSAVRLMGVDIGEVKKVTAVYADNWEFYVEVIIEVDRDLFTYEADAVAEHIPHRQSPAMSWQDTLGNMKLLDRWRREGGIVYEQERQNHG